MTRLVLLTLSSMLLATSAYAIDGQMLINQSTVMAAGGFPYKIMQPGSYKLTGNLTMTTTPGGNISGIDVAIGIISNQVTLDLNGFTIFIVNNLAFLGHDYYAIAELGTFTGVTVKNGIIAGASANLLTSPSLFGIYLHSSTLVRIEGVTLTFDSNTRGNATGFDVGQGPLIRGVSTNAPFSYLACPSVVVETVGTLVPGPGSSCQTSLNATSF